MPGPNSPYTALSADQVIQQSFDEANDRLRVDASITATIGDIKIDAEESDIAIKDRVTDNLLAIENDGSINVNVNIDAASGDNIAISDGTNELAIESDGSINVNVVGAATEAKQDSQITILNSIDSKLTAPISVTASSLPLPTGAATEAKQDSQITQLTSISNTLTSIDNGIPAFLGQQNMANSMSVVLASDQTALPLSTNAATESKQDSQITILNSIDAGIPSALGQQTMAASMSVVLASNQTPISVTATLTDEPVKISGTEDGTASGTEYGFVYNQKQQVLAAQDREEDYTYADFGTKDQRITRVEYSSSVFPGITVRRDFSYSLVGTRYRRDSSNWSII